MAKQNKTQGFIAQIIVNPIGRPEDLNPLVDGTVDGLPFAFGVDPVTFDPIVVLVTPRGKAYYKVSGASLVKAAAEHFTKGLT